MSGLEFLLTATFLSHAAVIFLTCYILLALSVNGLGSLYPIGFGLSSNTTNFLFLVFYPNLGGDVCLLRAVWRSHCVVKDLTLSIRLPSSDTIAFPHSVRGLGSGAGGLFLLAFYSCIMAIFLTISILTA